MALKNPHAESGLIGSVSEASSVEEKTHAYKWAIRSGHVMAGFLLVAFVAIYGLRSYQFDMWRDYFFRDTVNFENLCGFAAIAGGEIRPSSLDDMPLTPVKIPHVSNLIEQTLGKSGPYFHVRYLCKVTTASLDHTSGIPYLHLGWIFAEKTDIFINGERRLSFVGTDKPIVPVRMDDLHAKDLVVEIKTTSLKSSRSGISGLAPLVLGLGSTTNFRIFGLETAMQNITVLYSTLPLITLALVLIFGWIYGLRSRLIVTTFFFFTLSLLYQLPLLFSDFAPWDISFTGMLSLRFCTGSWLAFLVFGMELLRYRQRFIAPMIALITVLVAAQIVWLTMASDQAWVSLWTYRACRYVAIVGGIVLVIASVRKLTSKSESEGLRTVTKWFSVLLAFYLTMLVSDLVIDEFKIPIYINHYMGLLLPLFVGGLLFHSLAQIEKYYQAEKVQRLKMEHDLELAHEIQDSLAPSPNYLHKNSIKINTHQIKHSQVAGDWMALREMPGGGLALLVADATGKGVQAALVVHAVQSLWAGALDEAQFHPEEWIIKVNRTLRRLGERKPHSLTLGVVVITEDKVVYYSAGHIPLFYMTYAADIPKVSALVSTGGLLGLSDKITIKPAEFQRQDGEKMTLLLATDGVFDRGSRTNKNDVLKLTDQLALRGTAALADCPADDDKTLLLIEINHQLSSPAAA